MALPEDCLCVFWALLVLKDSQRSRTGIHCARAGRVPSSPQDPDEARVVGGREGHRWAFGGGLGFSAAQWNCLASS